MNSQMVLMKLFIIYTQQKAGSDGLFKVHIL